MSSKYQKPYTIPEGFPALLKSFTREILRSQPDNIYDFGARFFADMLDQGGGYVAERQPGPNATSGGAGSSVLDSMQQTATSINIKALSPAELEALILKLFLEADLDKSGYLDRTEFAAVLKKADLGLTERQMREVLAEADENDDEVIQYQEFLPVMVDILQSIKAKEQAKNMMGQVEALVRGEVEGMLLHGMPPDELQGLMLKVFRRADKDRSGQLSRSEFKDALRAAELGLTRKDINLVLSTVDVNNDGLVSYEEFVPVCFEVLVERFKDEIMTNNIVSNQEGLQGLLLKSLQEADPERTGQLPQRTIKGVLQKLSYEVLGLSTLQVVSIVSQANTAPDGTVSYVTFVPVAAAMIYSMYDVDSMKLRLQAIKTVADAGGIKDLTHMDIDGLRQTLEAAFKEADVAVTGQLSQAQVVDVLNRLGTLTPDTVNLTEAHMNAMFAAIDVDESGTVDWYELATFLCDAIEHMERELYVQSVTQGGGQH